MAILEPIRIFAQMDKLRHSVGFREGTLAIKTQLGEGSTGDCFTGSLGLTLLLSVLSILSLSLLGKKGF